MATTRRFGAEGQFLSNIFAARRSALTCSAISAYFGPLLRGAFENGAAQGVIYLSQQR
jgi:hypothetical protein